ncbi:restriction endonuclease subunit S [Lacticaseibacillus paracasei]|jgi:type I restriction enzyme, S subunit|uniref:Putative nucleotidyltransferases n=1 Tax=Lacticaseibacillus paracasei TaxID=1597 RepID=A0A8B3GHW9_LACPA|nr:restriction endonuclease subunit S [Lacticaseibacillus paracasei]MBB1168849.1 restriction endonuclease subunit S [Lacticaseibacillus paracasei]MDO5968007.1 restriction endonuclease subunit S [Lacticaseibacillus paracasei]RNE10579.1 putative nucleotidyltransferases [Lacticaseibacillus paracasei]RNE25276.1 putative nucleotidyltransferases [Lacticaseibacillus paracasei]
MKDNQAKYPQLRFKGFTDPWEQRKLSDFSKTTYGGGTPKTAVTEYWDGNIPWIQSSNLTVDDVQEVNLDKFITDDAIKNSAAKLIPANSIAIVTRVGVGKLTLMKQEFATSQDFLSLSELHVDEQFGLYSIYKLLQKELNNIQGTSIKGMTKADLLTKDIMIPVEKDEQIKIGSFFKQLDHLITLHQRKLAKLKELKQGYLQKLFPENGSKFPQLRFAGFADAWEQRKVSELADRYDNLRVPITASERVAGETPYYGANGIQDYVERFTHNGEFVLVAEDGANDLQNYPVQYVDGKVWVNNHAHVLQAKEERVDNKFLTNALKHTNIEPYLVGGGRAKLNADVMMKINFKVPTLPEQVQIGKFFDNLDHLITLHQRKLEKLQELKKGYLQKMFC